MEDTQAAVGWREPKRCSQRSCFARQQKRSILQEHCKSPSKRQATSQHLHDLVAIHVQTRKGSRRRIAEILPSSPLEGWSGKQHSRRKTRQGHTIPTSARAPSTASSAIRFSPSRSRSFRLVRDGPRKHHPRIHELIPFVSTSLNLASVEIDDILAIASIRLLAGQPVAVEISIGADSPHNAALRVVFQRRAVVKRIGRHGRQELRH